MRRARDQPRVPLPRVPCKELEPPRRATLRARGEPLNDRRNRWVADALPARPVLVLRGGFAIHRPRSARRTVEPQPSSGAAGRGRMERSGFSELRGRGPHERRDTSLHLSPCQTGRSHPKPTEGAHTQGVRSTKREGEPLDQAGATAARRVEASPGRASTSRLPSGARSDRAGSSGAPSQTKGGSGGSAGAVKGAGSKLGSSVRPTNPLTSSPLRP